MEHPIDRAIRISGLVSIAALAVKLGVTRAAVSQWKSEGRRVPAEHCPTIEKLTHGEVICEELNDRVDWTFVRTASQTSQAAA